MKIFSYLVTLPGDCPFVNSFNKCTELYKKSLDKRLTEEEQLKYWNMFMDERIKLEMGYE